MKLSSWRWLGRLLVAVACISFPTPYVYSATKNDRNWVAVHLFDAIYPMDDKQSFPEALASIEIMNQLLAKRKVIRDLKKAFKLNPGPFGARQREGHYLIWIHLSDDFVARHPELDELVEQRFFMYDDRKTDIFTAWSGGANIAAFLKHGVVGLANVVTDANGAKEGRFQSFPEVVELGDADYSGGWYMTDAQAERIVRSIKSYQGPLRGYSFLRRTEEKPQPPYDPPGARLVNGYNCGDFAYHALTSAGVMSRDDAEAIKVNFWYPKAYFDRPLPLRGSGQRGFDWLNKHPEVQKIPDGIMVQIGWGELLFGTFGLEFFDKRKLVDEIRTGQHELERARLWDQAAMIEYLKAHADFEGKGIVTELLPAVQARAPITSPDKTITDTPQNNFRMSDEFSALQSEGAKFEARKLKRARIWGKDHNEFRAYWNSLKK